MEAGTTATDSVTGCVECGKGTYSAVQGANAAAQCNDCPPGTYGDQVG